MFSYDSPFSRFMRLISGLFCLSLCWLAGSLPVFCYGASSAALATVTLRMVRGEQVRLFRDFFAAYRANFRQGTVLGLLGLAAAMAAIQPAVPAPNTATSARRTGISLAGRT